MGWELFTHIHDVIVMIGSCVTIIGGTIGLLRLRRHRQVLPMTPSTPLDGQTPVWPPFPSALNAYPQPPLDRWQRIEVTGKGFQAGGCSAAIAMLLLFLLWLPVLFLVEVFAPGGWLPLLLGIAMGTTLLGAGGLGLLRGKNAAGRHRDELLLYNRVYRS